MCGVRWNLKGVEIDGVCETQSFWESQSITNFSLLETTYTRCNTKSNYDWYFLLNKAFGTKKSLLHTSYNATPQGFLEIKIKNHDLVIEFQKVRAIQGWLTECVTYSSLQHQRNFFPRNGFAFHFSSMKGENRYGILIWLWSEVMLPLALWTFKEALKTQDDEQRRKPTVSCDWTCFYSSVCFLFCACFLCFLFCCLSEFSSFLN